jgi:putative ABC transport system permease protein
MYEQEIRVSRILTFFAFVAILISLLGLIAMSTYYIQQRAKEIAIRKVFGSSCRQVRTRLICTFLAYVGLAALIALPVICYIVSDWIAQYAYRIAWWYCILLSILSVGVIGFCAVAIQSWAASGENPVNQLKNE